MNSSLRHVGIVVTEIDVWLDFLVDLLGFKVWINQIEEGEFISQLLGIPNVQVRTIKLMDSKGGVIELLNYIAPVKEAEHRPKLEPNSLGITHIALQVEDLDSLLPELSKRGYLPIFPPQISKDMKVKVLYLRGPENELFELVQTMA
jgi:hypothetical protein